MHNINQTRIAFQKDLIAKQYSYDDFSNDNSMSYSPEYTTEHVIKMSLSTMQTNTIDIISKILAKQYSDDYRNTIFPL